MCCDEPNGALRLYREYLFRGPLRRFSDFLDADISMMTVHSAKGLEWDTVFIPGVTRFDWPGVICSRCESAGMCSRSAYGYRIVDAKKMPDGLIEEMGLLYVGVTRARKAVHVSASMQRRTKCGNYQVACPSCLTSLPGIEPVSWAVMEGGGVTSLHHEMSMLSAWEPFSGSGQVSLSMPRSLFN